MAIFHSLVQAPKGTVPGKAKISIDFDSWTGRKVRRSTATAIVKRLEEKPLKKQQ